MKLIGSAMRRDEQRLRAEPFNVADAPLRHEKALSGGHR